MNPFAHVAIDAIVVTQIQQNNPLEVSQAYEQLVAAGSSHLDAIHRIDQVFVEEFWETMQHQKAFNTHRYVKKVNKLL